MDWSQLLYTEYFGNNIYQYMISLGVVIAFILFGKVADFILKRYILKVITKTKSKIDDIFVKAAEKPFLMLFFILGLFFGFKFLSFEESFNLVFNRITKSLVIFMLSWFFINLIDLLIEHFLEPLTRKSETDLDDHLVPLLRKLVKSVLVVIAFIMILSDLGFDVASILAGLGIGGLAFALAAKDLLANLFGGIAIIFDKSFSINQRIKVQGVDGKVKQIGLRTTVVESFDGTKLTIPNSKIADSVIENVSHEQARKITLTLGVSCNISNSKLEKTIKELKKLIDNHTNVKDKTVVRFDAFGNYTFDILVQYWISNLSQIGQTKHEINMAIKKKLEELNVDMPYPTQSVKLEK